MPLRSARKSLVHCIEGLRYGVSVGNLTKDQWLRLWWNWQTRYFEVVVAKAVQVQVLLSAPCFYEGKPGRASKIVVFRSSVKLF